MASLDDSIHSPHATLISKERQGVKSLLLTLKGIETRLRQNGHTTTFSEDGIYLTHGNAKVNCDGTRKVEQLVRAFKKRMNEEDTNMTTTKKPRVRACTPIPSPSDWQESNISRHAMDGMGGDAKTEVTASKRQRVTPLAEPPAVEERVNDKEDVASTLVLPDTSKLANDGNMPDSVHEEIGEDKHELVYLPLPAVAPRISHDWKMPETIASPPQEKPRVKLPPPAVETLLSEIDLTLCHIDTEPPVTDVAEVHQGRPQDSIDPIYDQTSHVLVEKQQARIQELERELKQADAARLAAEDRTRELVEEAYPAVSGPQERAKIKAQIKDQAEEILKLTSNDQIMEQHPERFAKAIAELQVVYSRRLQKLDRTTNSIWKTLNNSREGRKAAAEDLARIQTTVERHDSEWLPKLADRLSVIETDLKALWAASHDHAPSDSASGSSSP